MVTTENKPIAFFQSREEIDDLITEKEALIFLDYDGTLTPIVDTPDLAILDNSTRETIQRLAACYKTSIVSGRATEDVKSKVQIEGIFYAGSHGFEILSPDGKSEINSEARAICPLIDEAQIQLEKNLKDIDGVLVENVKYTISVHYRLVSDKDFLKVETAVKEIINSYDQLKVTYGKKVFEIKPDIDWHKGKAVQWILKVLNYTPKNNFVIYIGDDTTDEDAFSMIGDKGFGILVAGELRASAAKYWIKDTDEVKKVLEYLIGLKA